MRRSRTVPGIAAESFLRRVDARVKLLIALAATAAVALPLAQLAVFVALYVLLTVRAGLSRHVVVQLRRVMPLAAIVFVVDTVCVGVPFAVLITLRLGLMAAAFSIFSATTTAAELRAALESLRVPARLAFVFSVAFHSLTLLEAEWQGVLEAQRARGIGAPQGTGWGRLRQLPTTVALIAPAMVLITQRAWSITEAATTRGLESPVRRPLRQPRFSGLDRWLAAGTTGVLVVLAIYR